MECKMLLCNLLKLIIIRFHPESAYYLIVTGLTAWHNNMIIDNSVILMISYSLLMSRQLLDERTAKFNIKILLCLFTLTGLCHTEMRLV